MTIASTPRPTESEKPRAYGWRALALAALYPLRLAAAGAVEKRGAQTRGLIARHARDEQPNRGS
jgi:hypothetical protein